jgi:peptide/nickel transport system permease protein
VLKYLAVRVAAIVPLLLAVAVISFGLVGLLELRGSAAEQILQEGAGDPEAVAALEAELGLDEPLPVRFVKWLGGALRGDFGNSLLFTDVPVSTLISERIWPTLSIVAVGLVVGSLVGIAFGLLSALRPGGPLDRGLSVVSAVMIATPGFVLGIFLVIVFAVELGWFEPTGYNWPSDEGWLAWLQSIMLPGLALAFPIVAVVQRQLRSSMTNALASRYVLAARARGLPAAHVVRHHAMRNAMIPTITVIGFQAAGAIGLTVAIERVFAIPGMGSLLAQAVTQRDIPVIQGSLMVATLVVAIVNLLVDLAYGWLNPRIRLT